VGGIGKESEAPRQDRADHLGDEVCAREREGYGKASLVASPPVRVPLVTALAMLGMLAMLPAVFMIVLMIVFLFLSAPHF
jgi:hypothetical protein